MQQKHNVGDRVVVVDTGTVHDGKSLTVGLIHLHTGGYLLIDESGDSVVSVDEKNIRSTIEMTKVSVEIEIPDGHEVVGVPICDYSGPTQDGTRAYGFHVDTRPAKPLIICGQPAEWPEWLGCDWIARNKDGSLWGYINVEPERNTTFWFTRSPGAAYQISCVNIHIPGPWDQSLRENPRRKK